MLSQFSSENARRIWQHFTVPIDSIRRSLIGTLAAALLLQGFVLALILTQILALAQPMESSLSSLPYRFVSASLVVLSILVIQPRLSVRAHVVLLVFVLITLGILNAVDLTFQLYFSEPALSIAKFLPPPQADAAKIVTFWSVFKQYVPVSYVLVTLVCLVPISIGLYLFGSYRLPTLAPAAFLATVAVVWSQALPLSAGLFTSAVLPTPLHKADRTDSLVLLGKSRFKPPTILLILNESTSYFSASAKDPTIRLTERIKELSGNPNAWIEYSNAVTNSSCTEISQPSIFTGTGSNESYKKLHQMPFIFDMAKARDYTTVFYTSQTLEWSGLATFFSAAKIDFLLSATTSGTPVINDLGVDDIDIMERLVAFIRTRGEENLFIVAGTNAMHGPFQATSKISIPSGLNRHRKALYILEHAHKILFDALRDTNRLDDALIIVTADHGEPQSDEQRRIPRIENYLEDTLRVPFLVHLPQNLPLEMHKALQANVGSLVANVDIAPSLADVLGATLSKGLAYVGYSLFKNIPDSRLSIATSTNDWRYWPRNAIAIARKHDRFVCRSTEACNYYNVSEGASLTAAQREDRYWYYLNEGLQLPGIGKVISRIGFHRPVMANSERNGREEPTTGAVARNSGASE